MNLVVKVIGGLVVLFVFLGLAIDWGMKYENEMLRDANYSNEQVIESLFYTILEMESSCTE